MGPLSRSAEIKLLVTPDRRSYLAWLAGLCAAGVGVTLSIPLARFALYPMTAKTAETKWSDAGAISEIPSQPTARSIVVEQIDGWRKTSSEKAIYVSNDSSGQPRVLSAVCPHLGCSVQWSADKDRFVCPCHSAVFSADGVKISGPAPRGMDPLEAQVKDGRLLVRYQYFRQLVPTREVIG